MRHEVELLERRVASLQSVLERCRTVLGNMALENERKNWWTPRWAISDEPLRNDAKSLLSVIDNAMAE